MRKSSPIPKILQSGGFSFHYYLGRYLRLGFFWQSCVVAAIIAAGMLLVSRLDHSWILPRQDVGLLEHPGLWGFPLLQILVPLCVRQSLQKFQQARLHKGEIKKVEGKPSALVGPLRKFLGWHDKASKIAAAVIYLIGFTAIAWNTIQNQKPGIVVPYDFWDSKHYLWGFIYTRFYKLYLFGWFLPYIGMIQAGIIIVTLRFVRRARLTGKLRLFPFHPDGVGGLGFVASLISTPVIITIVVGSLATAVVFFAHGGVAVTPIMALVILIGWALLGYFVPILFLRSDIVAMKREALETLRGLQQENYAKITQTHGHDVEMLGKGKEALEYFDKVCANIQAISNYPHLRLLLRLSSISLLPSLVQIGIKLYQNAGPLLTPLLKPH